MKKKILEKPNDNKYLIVIFTWIGMLAANILFTGVTLGNYIDIPSLIIVTGTAYIAIYMYGREIQSYIIGSAIVYMLIDFLAVLNNLKIKEHLPQAMSVTIIILLYALIYQFFIHNIYTINKMKHTYEIEKGTPLKEKKIIALVGISLLLLLCGILNGAGIGIYIDIPSAISIGSIVVVYLIDDKYKRLLMIKNFIIGFPFIIFITTAIKLLNNTTDLTVIGQSVGGLLISLLYLIVAYLILYKAQFKEYKIKTLSIEIILFTTTFISFISIVISFFLILN